MFKRLFVNQGKGGLSIGDECVLSNQFSIDVVKHVLTWDSSLLNGYRTILGDDVELLTI